ncbi:RNA polymerase sigma-70 factor [Oricola thermophila]|uniref:RNA polymerase sigma-70 factor n=1 Tax=Oricola thermophila TaxID=2742145 RepID=A0A6N1VG02_9HYPH|nr:RNA polymerase sigma-70 factor [Oricola thermophila]QKV18162.1 RNA polymerase sigma-70 factor [Oricola thermophila]
MAASTQPEFDSIRPRLFGIAYRMLGSASEAEDMVQDAWLRWHGARRDAVDDPEAYLVRTVTRLCLDHLKSARVRRETYVGEWLPEPLPTGDGPAELFEAISFAFLVALERLTPPERAAYLLHEVFGYSHAEVGAILERSPEACRQLHMRAGRALRADRPRFDADPREHRRLLDGFVAACRAQDLDGLVALLSADVVARSDGGGRVRTARRSVHGADAVSRLFIGLARNAAGGLAFDIRAINGRPAVVATRDGRPVSVIQISVAGGRIAAIDSVLNPDKLAAVATALPADPPGIIG